ncbi:unnamed protein product [Prorocentrum cordatum]|uniref:PPM-type phosphatase domain-containing protein n=1 Tax=Prorocentrum cordatum TaxID=2364126 RepID=A0ABN9XUY6_9DINO|nr:unnamed protein product [Polarella glacialis]
MLQVGQKFPPCFSSSFDVDSRQALPLRSRGGQGPGSHATPPFFGTPQRAWARALPPPLARRRLTSADLDAWARGPTVRGHAHSRPTFERYGLSLVREVGGGAAVPEDWAVRLLSATGAKGSEGPNQDAFSYTLLDSGWIVCVACDGHGEHGEVVAERVARALPLFLSPHLLEHDPEVALRRAFAEAQLDLERCFRSAQVYSGAAVAACCVHSERREAWTAHAGDSQVVLGDLGGGGVVCYTEEHKAHDPGELERLREAGAQVIQKRYDDGELVSRIFIPRTGIPGLAMSRSLGDGCLKKYGVCADPEVQDMSTLWRACAAPVLLLASDGLWDMVTPGAAVEVLASRCRSGLDVLLGVEVLLRRSQRLWIEAEGDYCDDVTVLLVAPSASLAAATSCGRVHSAVVRGRAREPHGLWTSLRLQLGAGFQTSDVGACSVCGMERGWRK